MEIMTLNDSSHSDTATTSLLNQPSLMTTPDANLALLIRMSPELVGAYIMAQQKAVADARKVDDEIRKIDDEIRKLNRFASLTPEQAAAYKLSIFASLTPEQAAAYKADAEARKEAAAKNDVNDFLVSSSRTSPHLNLDSPHCQISRCFCASNQRLCPREALLLCPSHLHFQIVCVVWGIVCHRGAFILASQRKRRSRPDDSCVPLLSLGL
jgi:hypothetical protein